MAWQLTISFVDGGVPNTEGGEENPSSRVPVVVEIFDTEAEADTRAEYVLSYGYTVTVDGIETLFPNYALLYMQKEQSLLLYG